MGLKDILSFASGPLSAGISAIGSLFNNASANKYNIQSVRETNAMNYKIAQENMSWQERMMDKMNEYNSAAQQVARYKEAGINPALAMSGGATASASPASSPGMPGLQAPQKTADNSGIVSAANILSDSAYKLAGVRNLDANTNYTNIDTLFNEHTFNDRADAIHRGAIGIRLDNDMKTLMNTLEKQTQAYKIKNASLQNDYMDAQITAARLDNETKQVMNKYLDAQQQADLALKVQQNLKLIAEISRIKRLSPLEERLMIAQYKKTLAEEQLAVAHKAGVDISNDIARRTADDLVTQAHQTTVVNNLDYWIHAEDSDKAKRGLDSRLSWNGYNPTNFIESLLRPFGGSIPFLFGKSFNSGRSSRSSRSPRFRYSDDYTWKGHTPYPDQLFF